MQRALNELLDAGLIVFTKAWHHGRHKIYKLFFTAEKSSCDATSVKNDVPRTSPMTDDVRQICSNINKENNHNNEHNNAPEKIVVASLENKTVEILRDKGIAKEQAHKLVTEVGEECIKQVQHLELVQSQNKQIGNSVAWLVSAIKRRFALSETKVEKPQESELVRKHKALLRQAKIEMHFENWPEAARIAREALALGEHDTFRKIIADAQGKVSHA